MPKPTLTIQSAAEILGVSPQTLRAWDTSGKLKAHREPKSGYRLYQASQLEAFAKKWNIRRKDRLPKLAP